MEPQLLSHAFNRPPASQVGGNCSDRPAIRDSAGNLVSEVALPGASTELRLPLLESGGLLLTDRITVNGRSVGWFLLDTGANFSMLDRSAVAAAGIKPGQRLMSLGDPREPDGAYRISSLTVGDVSIRNHAILVSSLPRARNVMQLRLAGILGGDVWGALPFALDYKNSTVTFFGRRDFHPPTAARAETLNITHKPDPRHLFASANPFASQPSVHGTINGVRTSCLLDTGCTRTVVLTADFAQQHQDWLQFNRPPCAPDSFLSGGRYVSAIVRHLELLGSTREDVRDAVAMVGDWTAMPGTDVPATSQTIGAAFLRDFRLTFDYAGGMIWSERISDNGVTNDWEHERNRWVSHARALAVRGSES
ncbi:MAG TPA: pepsin/retropepsin-like aspartic protease family protein [Phycisphaerae bacterium]|nr:pepsin/retropepsin-like aspartic protease family protein [Phycisphaerae bacterium]